MAGARVQHVALSLAASARSHTDPAHEVEAAAAFALKPAGHVAALPHFSLPARRVSVEVDNNILTTPRGLQRSSPCKPLVLYTIRQHRLVTPHTIKEPLLKVTSDSSVHSAHRRWKPTCASSRVHDSVGQAGEYSVAHSGSSRLTVRNGDVLEKSAEVPALTGVRTLFEDILALRWDLRSFPKRLLVYLIVDFDNVMLLLRQCAKYDGS